MRSIRLGVIADPHVSLDRVEDAAWHNRYRLADARDRLVTALAHPLIADADAVVLLGDLAHFGDAATLSFVVEATRNTGRPAVLLSGNHDVLEDGVRLWDFTLPTPPIDLLASAGLVVEVHQVTALARAGWQPFDVASSMLIDDARGPQSPLLVLTHFPVSGALESRCRDAGFLYAAHLAQLAPPPPTAIRAGRPTVVLSGHLHLRGVAVDGDLLNIVFAALVEPPYEVARVDIDTGPDDGVGGACRVSYQCASVREAEPGQRLPVLDRPAGGYAWTAGQGWRAETPP